MFGRNKKIIKKIEEESNLIINEIIERSSEIDVSITHKNLRVDKLSDKIDKLEEKITKMSETTQIEADFMEKLLEIFASATPLSTISEAEERMQILSDKIDKLEADKRELVGKIGGLTSGNNKLKKKNNILKSNNQKMLKDLQIYQKNNGYIPKKIRPTKAKIQKLKETVKPVSIIK